MSLLKHATRFEIPPSPEVHAKLFPPNFTNGKTDTVTVESRGKGSWAIRWEGECLSRDLTWGWEPQPSSRTTDFLARTRFSLNEALTLLGRSDLVENT